MKALRNTRGIAIIYVTLFLLVLGVLFVALGIDVGWMAYVRTQGQAAVDAAALRGAAALPNYNNSGDPNLVYSMAKGLNSDNTVMNNTAGIQDSDVLLCTGGTSSPSCSSGLPALATGVKVTRTYPTPLFFPKILNGGSNVNITVSSVAWLGGPGGFCSKIPLALCAQNIGYDPDAGDFTCRENLDSTLIPNGTDTAGWWAPLPESANAEWCKGVLDGTKIPCTGLGEKINLNNGEINVCQGKLENMFAALGCFTAGTGQTPGTPGTQCDPGVPLDNPLRIACTVTLPVIKCPNSINQQQEIIGYASVCIKYVQDNPDAITKVNLECSASALAPGGGPTLGTYATRPALVK